MRHHRLFYHLVWTTRDRAPLITAGLATFLQRLFGRVAAEERAFVLATGIVSTHVHLLLRFDPTVSIPRLVQRLKGGSAVLATREGLAAVGHPLRWAKGYSLTTVHPHGLDRIGAYVHAQSERHPAEAILGWAPEAVDPDLSRRFSDTG